MNKYKHGEEVHVQTSAGDVDFIDACIVGVSVVETEDAAKHFDAPIGAVFYTVEFPDGSDALVPEDAVHTKS